MAFGRVGVAAGRTVLLLVILVFAWRLFGASLRYTLGNVGQVFEPRAGWRMLSPATLPVAAIRVVDTLRTLDASEYALSPAVLRNDLVRQRIIEGAWPIRPVDDAPVIVKLSTEAVAPCKAAHPAGPLVVYDCR